VFGNVDGGSGSDLITIASDPADVLGGTGDDVINIVTGAVVTGSVYGDDNDGFEGDDGNDTINLFGGFVANHVFGEGGDDVITLAGTVIGGNLSGDGGDDTLLITGGSVTNVFGGDGDDTATWTDGTISNSVGMGTGTDTLDIYGVNAGGTAFQAGLSVLDGGDDASSADGQVDTLNLHGVVEVLTDLQNWEFINLVDTSVGDLGQASRSIVTEQFFVEFGSTLVATGNFGSTQTYVIDGDLWNDGIVDMHDFGPSYDELAVTGTYTGGPDSLIRMDTFLGGPGSPSDLMIVGTATAGESALFIYDTNAGPGAYHPNGIPVVDVSTGTTDADHFTLVDGNTGLGGPIDKGLFFYDLVLRPDNVHVLVGAPDLEAFQLGRVPAQAQTAWHSSTGVWHDRTADLRAHLDGSAAPGPRGPVSPGFWMRGFGSFLDRDDDAMFAPFPDGFDPGPKSYHFNTSYDQDTYGGFAGLDWAWNGVFAAGDAGMLGAFGGYVGWKSRFDQQSRNGGISTLEASGASFGLYTTYLNQGFFVDGVFKADLPDIELSFPGLEPFGPSTDTVDARSLGGVLDAGYRIPFGTAWYVEGLSTLSYVNTDIDAASLGGSEIDFADDQSFRGRLGMGMGGTFTAGEVATVVSRLSFSAWHEFDGDNGTDIFSPGGAPLDIRHDVSGTFGEVSAVVDVFGNTNGLSFYVKADYRFSKDVSEYAGSIGLRFTP
ncbi:MAG: autotransporter outer membrane beta-barrel domain-containing protein, partial [Alphaproteobacteria bacterium]